MSVVSLRCGKLKEYRGIEVILIKLVYLICFWYYVGSLERFRFNGINIVGRVMKGR